MADDDDDLCPLCCNVLSKDDRRFRPCPCGYQKIRETEHNRCPACRQTYDQDNFAYLSSDEEDEEDSEDERRSRRRTSTSSTSNNNNNSSSSSSSHTISSLTTSGSSIPSDTIKKALSTVRVIQRNLVYVTNLAMGVAKPETLKKNEYFGQYGKILKVVINKNHIYNANSPHGACVSAYITYQRKEDALSAIQSIDGATVEGRTLRASFGTTKYCSYFLRKLQCNNPDCMYLHEWGQEDDSFTKEDMTNINRLYIGHNEPAVVISPTAAVAGGQPPLSSSTPGTTSTSSSYKKPISLSTSNSSTPTNQSLSSSGKTWNITNTHLSSSLNPLEWPSASDALTMNSSTSPPLTKSQERPLPSNSSWGSGMRMSSSTVKNSQDDMMEGNPMGPSSASLLASSGNNIPTSSPSVIATTPAPVPVVVVPVPLPVVVPIPVPTPPPITVITTPPTPTTNVINTTSSSSSSSSNITSTSTTTSNTVTTETKLMVNNAPPPSSFPPLSSLGGKNKRDKSSKDPSSPSTVLSPGTQLKKEEKERIEREKLEKLEREKEKQLEKERQMEKERLLSLERERQAEKEKMLEKERLEKEKQLEKEKEKQEKERLERLEKARLEILEKEAADLAILQSIQPTLSSLPMSIGGQKNMVNKSHTNDIVEPIANWEGLIPDDQPTDINFDWLPIKGNSPQSSTMIDLLLNTETQKPSEGRRKTSRFEFAKEKDSSNQQQQQQSSFLQTSPLIVPESFLSGFKSNASSSSSSLNNSNSNILLNNSNNNNNILNPTSSLMENLSLSMENSFLSNQTPNSPTTTTTTTTTTTNILDNTTTTTTTTTSTSSPPGATLEDSQQLFRSLFPSINIRFSNSRLSETKMDSPSYVDSSKQMHQFQDPAIIGGGNGDWRGPSLHKSGNSIVSPPPGFMINTPPPGFGGASVASPPPGLPPGFGGVVSQPPGLPPGFGGVVSQPPPGLPPGFGQPPSQPPGFNVVPKQQQENGMDEYLELEKTKNKESRNKTKKLNEINNNNNNNNNNGNNGYMNGGGSSSPPIMNEDQLQQQQYIQQLLQQQAQQQQQQQQQAQQQQNITQLLQLQQQQQQQSKRVDDLFSNIPSPSNFSQPNQVPLFPMNPPYPYPNMMKQPPQMNQQPFPYSFSNFSSPQRPQQPQQQQQQQQLNNNTNNKNFTEFIGQFDQQRVNGISSADELLKQHFNQQLQQQQQQQNMGNFESLDQQVMNASKEVKDLESKWQQTKLRNNQAYYR
ncbi:RING zinc finger-containing protein [Cavenderia fasciculata]|uniref:RING zinc finger-containing protein n=1 Tax=Cavenderia fasciculata TaxID=261658 RepID=F4Q3G3_CACFS|nr:RING zinc finger-containing protein [Cavenderia fasciculata]EGG16832.1 RING zinc finger-containing protein [Cavenderia fasciculata]|eukprot:XP_004355306.1 RING zinc finger-containing protein [Cavenderia fasciculata]